MRDLARAHAGTREADDRAPLRAELFSVDQMERHGEALAHAHALSRSRTPERLLRRLDENERTLAATCELLTAALKAESRLVPAGVWLVDNFPLIDEQVRTARKHLPKGYSREIPRLASGPSRGLPRVYDLALEAIAHGDGRVDAESLVRFVAAYQRVTPLTLGELWAIPIMLRLALIENLSRVGMRIRDDRVHREQAADWADRMMEIARRDPKALILVIGDMARSDPPLVGPFVAELARRLQGHGRALALPLTWIEQRLAESSLTIAQLVWSENQQQAADQVSIGNTIGSLRFLGATDWHVFVETVSLVEQVLRQDGARGNHYGRMDFATRDGYRHAIAAIARRSEQSELAVARAAMALANASAETARRDAREAHVGYYLIDQGRPRLEAVIGFRPSIGQGIRRVARRHAMTLYVGSIVLVTLAFAAGLSIQVDRRLLGSAGLALLGSAILLAASQLATALVNWLSTLLTRPRRTPRMDCSRGVPAQWSTLVVVPALLSGPDQVAELLEALEVRFLGNRDDHVHFGLLTDFRDAPLAELETDGPLLLKARDGIESLNRKYAGSSGGFFLFHRPRRWNAADRVWMGYERKRGKLEELNAALRGAGFGRFERVVGQVEALPGVRYVITLDTDTLLPRDSARQMVGAMAHPLNRPEYDALGQRVMRGYGLMQPRVDNSLSGSGRSRYARMWSGEPGIDPYTRSASDVYQDVFDEGSFIGKGIYDVDAFERVLAARLPDNRVLSHDLLEGAYVRSGLLSDVHLYEEPPARYSADVTRQRRWIRGDWQIAQWLLPRIPGPTGTGRPNPLSALSRWKILDNLRRCLVAPALLVLLVPVWTAPSRSLAWTALVIGVLVIPPALRALLDAVRKDRDRRWSAHVGAVTGGAGRSFAQAGFRIACLPYEAAYSLGAVIRTAWRMAISRRGLLEWNVSMQSDAGGGLLDSYRTMWTAPLAAIAMLGAASLHGATRDALATSPILCLWLLAPGIAWWLSRPLERREEPLSAEQTLFLRRMARKTWAFFDRFVTAEDHWLPPDNFQETPVPVVAHRTSPTNIGLALLANLAAMDFGYISGGAFLARTASTFGTLSRLPRHRGHFFNWYDTRSLQVLAPRYISSVDSGNFAGHLLTLRSALEAMPDQSVIPPRLFAGLLDTLANLRAHAPASFDERFATWCEPMTAPLSTPSACYDVLARLATACDRIAGSDPGTDDELRAWADALSRQVRDALGDLEQLMPWLSSPSCVADFARVTDVGSAPTLRQLVERTDALRVQVDDRIRAARPDEHDGLKQLRRHLVAGHDHAVARLAQCARLAVEAGGFATMEFEFLYDRTRHLLAIGHDVDASRTDTGFYDLLASEARLCVFVAIAQGLLPQESWFALGRQMSAVGGRPVLSSWSGSMFEYLMPLLVMPSYENTLLDQTCREVVALQIEHGDRCAVPWGISESGYSSVDASSNYQYRAFGVPGLGLQRGLGEDTVIAPYASVLALMVRPVAACANLQRLSAEGVEGRYGWYEAVDYSPTRLSRGQSRVVVRSFMAHHQGMSLLSLCHRLLRQPMQRRFEAAPMFQATLPLLHERIPKPSRFDTGAIASAGSGAALDTASSTTTMGADTPHPEVQLMSNGRYHVMVTNAGGGYSRWNDLAITRWHEDATCDGWGTFLYLRDVASGAFWSAARQPVPVTADRYEATFSEGRAEIRRRDHEWEAHSEIVVSPEDDIELRRLRVTNLARVPRTIEVTSYAEVVLASPAADAMQPAFGNLFVRTEIMAACRAILCTRRPRSITDAEPWMFHLLAADGRRVQDVSYETDRVRFIGRGRALDRPQVMSTSAPLSGSDGSVLDPIVAIRCRLTLDPGESTTLDWISGAAASREACLALVDKYQDRHRADRVLDLAWTHAGVALRQINATEADAQLYRRLAGPVLYATSTFRAGAAVLEQNRRGQAGLWAYSISGDLPIVLLRIAGIDHLELARRMIQCHAYWRLKGLAVDLVIWNEDHADYRQLLHLQIMALIADGIESPALDRPGGIFVRSTEQISDEDRTLLQSVARLVIGDARRPSLEPADRGVTEGRATRLVRTQVHRPEESTLAAPARKDLLHANGLGGFSPDGREYVITTTATHRTPAPWANVIANAGFGTIVSESGPGYTWHENAHEFRLTPWNADAVSTASGEAFYLRDEESGHFWSPTPAPRGGEAAYQTRHGFGYSVFEHTGNGIRSELWIYVDLKDPVKFSVLKIRNQSGRARRLSATGYVEWVLGDLRAKGAMHVVTEIDPTSGALFARNAFNAEFGQRVAFFDVDDLSRTLSGDRTEFLGRNGSLWAPDAMTAARLSGRLGTGLDPCGAIQVPVDLADGQEREIIFRLGAGTSIENARDMARRLRRTGSARAALENVRQYWDVTLGAVQVRTQDPAVDVLANGWLVYQTLACRMWARSGHYQSGGAFGYRDQLQDAMALVHTEPQLVREHLLRCAERQYVQGDVQHWWHPPTGRGVRTRCSDDYLWLPLAVCRYVTTTGDDEVLAQDVPFLEGRPLRDDEESYYDLPGRSGQKASLYEHCKRAIVHGLRYGERGLPLMGSGDWNDGMNLVGIHGRGESVWLGFFLYQILTAFEPVARRRDDALFAARCGAEAERLRRNLERHAWDGAWYRRAWFDDGSPLGSSESPECSIDSIAQSWSVLSGAGDAGRGRAAMEAVDRRLVRRDLGLVQLLDPPFDRSSMNPGYIRGYLPGVRENGGQYTHAAIWAAMAFAQLGDGERAWELLRLVNPLNHARDARAIATYKVEPYVVAADVYARDPHGGRGGWTWYTGSAGWLYRLILESLLGLHREADRLSFRPCVPRDWTSFEVDYRFGATTYRIKLLLADAAAAEAQLTLDGVVQRDLAIRLVDDGQPHCAEIVILRSVRRRTELPVATA